MSTPGMRLWSVENIRNPVAKGFLHENEIKTLGHYISDPHDTTNETVVYKIRRDGSI